VIVLLVPGFISFAERYSKKYHRVKKSWEYEFFPGILDKGLYGYVTERRLPDIGTPERFARAKDYFRKDKK